MIEHTTCCHVVVPARRPSHDLDGCAMAAVADNVPARHEPTLAALIAAAPRMELGRRESATIFDHESAPSYRRIELRRRYSSEQALDH
jgi:hypothetical protein